MTTANKRWDLRVEGAFALDQRQWERFLKLLERSPRENPGLAKLFSQPSVFSRV